MVLVVGADVHQVAAAMAALRYAGFRAWSAAVADGPPAEVADDAAYVLFMASAVLRLCDSVPPVVAAAVALGIPVHASVGSLLADFGVSAA